MESEEANTWLSEKLGFEVLLLRSPDRLKELNMSYMH